MARVLRVRQRGAVMVPLLAWLAEGILEAFGAVVFFRRRMAVLWPWLAFRAVADLIGIFLGSTSAAYNWLDHIQRHVQYIFLAGAVIYTVGKILRENRKTQRTYILMLCALVVACIFAVHTKWPLSQRALLSLETWAELILAAFICAAFAMAGGWAPKPWGVIGSALVIMAGSDGILTLLWMTRHWNVGPFYPIGAIVGLVILTVAGFRDWRLKEVSIPLGMKKPCTSVLVPRKVQARPM